MSIFDTIPLGPGPGTLKKAVNAVLKRAQTMRNASARYSLAEFALTRSDFDWLQAWINGLDKPTAEMCLHPDAPDPGTEEQMKHRFAIGTLLLIHASESIRRALPIESEWMLPAANLFPSDTRPILFLDGAPTQAHLSALKVAAKGLGLRQAALNGHTPFPVATPAGPVQQFNNFLLLQVGLTESQIHRHLPSWLMGRNLPPSILTLLDDEHGSRSFQKVWSALQAYHQLEISEEWLREILNESPWILPQWVDRIVDAIPAQAGMASSFPSQAISANVEASEARETEAEATGDIFASLLPFGGVKTVIKAVRLLHKRINSRSANAHPWSLAELEVSDYDYAWLRVWIQKLEKSCLRDCHEKDREFGKGDSLRLRAGLGLLLLLWLSETARRNAQEGQLWPNILSGHFETGIDEDLFSQGHSSEVLRDLLRAAVKRFNLRNVLEVDGVQRWMDTAFLQFGFTQNGARHRLGEWLNGQATTRTVSALLDPVTGSQSFQEMWNDLRAFQNDEVSEEEIRARLLRSPWILPTWAEDIIISAKNDQPQAGIIAPADSFLTQPLLRWPSGNTPAFVTQIADDLSYLQLKENSYDLFLGDELKAQLLRQSDGSYLPVPSRMIAIPFDLATLAASLKKCTGETVAEIDLALWPSQEDVVAYKLPSGEQIPDAFTYSFNHNAAYAILMAADLEISPEPAEWHSAISGNAILCRLQPGWPPDLQIKLQGEVLWEPQTRSCSSFTWTNEVGIFVESSKPVKWEKEFRAKIIHAPEIDVRYVRCQGRRHELMQADSKTTLAGPLTIGPECHSQNLEFRIGLTKSGQHCTVRRKLSLNLIGAAHLRNGNWLALNRHQHLTVEQAQRDLFRISLPEKWENNPLNRKDLVLFEGDGIAHLSPPASGSLGALTGWGAPLKLRQIFNAGPATPTLNLAGSVINHGILTEVVTESLRDGQAPLLRLGFRHLIEPNPSHTVVWWDQNGEIAFLSPRYWDEAEGTWWWVCDLPQQCRNPFAVAVAFNGEWQGAWWDERYWFQSLSSLIEKNSLRTAALLRWFHLPLLQESALPIFREAIDKHTTAFLRAWLKSEGVPGELVLPKPDESWRAVVRTLFLSWEPNADTALNALLCLADVDTEDLLEQYLEDAVHPLINVDPLLAAKLLRQWRNPRKNQLIQKLRVQIADVNHPANLQQRIQVLTDAIASQLRLNSAFISQGILHRATACLNGNPVNETDEKNLAVAVRIKELRKLLSIQLLAHI